MPGLLTAKGKDLLGWQGTRELMASIAAQLAKQLGRFDEEGEMALLHVLSDRIGEELAFEAGFAGRFAGSLAELESVADEEPLPALYRLLQELVAEQFQRRQAAIVCQGLCTVVRQRLMAKVLELAEKWMVKNGLGGPPSAYCCMAVGPFGREECTLYSEVETLLVYADEGKAAASYFLGLCRKGAAIMGQLGLVNGDASFTSHLWRGSLSEWRQRLTEGACDLVPLADLALVHGDQSLGSAMLNLVGAVQGFQRHAFGNSARRVATMPGGLDFFGRLKLEKSAGQKGAFQLEKHALLPLVGNVRILAIRDGVRETSTVARIRRLVEKGSLNVDLSERLLRAYHEIAALQIGGEVILGGRCLVIDAGQLTETVESRLKSSLESVANLQKIVFSQFMGQG